MQNQMTPSEIRLRKQYSIFDLRYLQTFFLTHRRTFVISWFLCLLMGAAYVYFGRPAYSVRARMLIVEKKSSNSVSAALMLQNQLPLGLGNNLGGNIGVENEKEILHSNLIAKDVVTDLGLYTEYRLQKWLKTRLLYKTQPINVEVSPAMLQFFDEELPLVRHQISLVIDSDGNCYNVEVVLKENGKKKSISNHVFQSLPAIIKTEAGELKLTENIILKPIQKKKYEKGYTLKVSIVPPMTMARKLNKITMVSSASKKAVYTVNLDIRDESVMRGIDFLNGLVKFYNQRSNQEKHREVERSDEFVKSRLAKIDVELDSADARWEMSKRQFQVTEPKVDAEEIMGKKSSYEGQLVNLGIQQQLLDYLSEYVNNPVNMFELIPVNVGVYSGDAVSLISRHNQLVNDLKLLLKSVTEQSSQAKQTTELINELHPVILTAIRRDKESLLLRKAAVEKEYNRYMSKVGSAPEQERVLTEIGRDRQIKQGVYMTLLQKREEYAVELSTTTDKGKKIDETLFLKKTDPKTVLAVIAALLLGFIIPYIIHFLHRSVKAVIDSEVDLALQTQTPLIGKVPFSPQVGCECEEAFRTVRANLLHQLGDKKRVILVTSNNEGDGKSFCSVNLAKSFAKIGEKILLCDLNFRHPSIDKELGIVVSGNLKTLLLSDDISENEILSSVVNSGISGLDILIAGDSSSLHPADILARKNLFQVLNCLRKAYDVIILDGLAIGTYSDSLIDGIADVTCYICCAGKTTKVEIEFLERMKEENRLASPCIVMNHIR